VSKYLLLMTVDDSYWTELTPEEQAPMMAAMEAYNQQLRDAGAWVGGEGIDQSANAKTVRPEASGGRTVTDGAFHDAPEHVGGYWVIEAASMDEAVEWAKKVPLSGGGIEVRALVPEDYAG
jgi:hypothetical protein